VGRIGNEETTSADGATPVPARATVSSGTTSYPTDNALVYEMACIGVKFTWNEKVFFGAIATELVKPVWLNGGSSVRDARCIELPPVLVMVAVCEEVEPRGVGGKLITFGLTLAAASVVVPVPEKFTTCGWLTPWIVNVSCPFTVPGATGLKRMAQLPNCPGCKVRVHPYSRMKTLNGLSENPVIISGVFPVFVTVTV